MEPFSTSSLLLTAGPSVAKGLASVLGLGKSKSSPEEQKLFQMSELFGSESSVPLTETTAFKSGKSILDQRDRDNRKAINNQSAVSGATNEAKLASMNASNRSYNDSLQRLLSYAQGQKNRNQSMYLNTLGALNTMRNQRQAQNEQRWSSILDPISQAGQSMMMADIFANKAG